ncbi:hypothetical protein OsJ_33241 [Oryza sativa Japonica Group]|uniref:1-phosphatidylinositol 4-kinase n=1 Tax=Oryza sativa subsp. japonica TaxID=39947 RepID=B9G9T1_ORYSJ|nr:hypothetical protein OsJ_33241 [Oryza sativa Japonica Group]
MSVSTTRDMVQSPPCRSTVKTRREGRDPDHGAGAGDAAAAASGNGNASAKNGAAVVCSEVEAGPGAAACGGGFAASIQLFPAHEYDAGELGPSRFSVASVHCVGILDVRLLNIDRYAGNILVKKSPESDDASGGSTSTPLDLLSGSGIAKGWNM